MKLAQIAQLLVIVLAAAAVYGFVGTARDAERRRVCTSVCAMRPNYAARNRLAPDFELSSLTGEKVRLSQYRGRVVILNFWTKTCPPCLEEMPSLAEFARVLEHDPRIVVLTITTDETVAEAQDTLKSVLGGPAPFTVLMDPEAAIVTGKYGTKLFPETWYIDGRGVIRARFDGARDWSGALPLDLAQSLLGKPSCSLEFTSGRPVGELAGICDYVGSAG